MSIDQKFLEINCFVNVLDISWAHKYKNPNVMIDLIFEIYISTMALFISGIIGKIRNMLSNKDMEKQVHAFKALKITLL